jgi:hypothetical protein
MRYTLCPMQFFPYVDAKNDLKKIILDFLIRSYFSLPLFD